jgi:hypothetical protein
VIGRIGAQVVAAAASRRIVEPRFDPLRVSPAAPAEHHAIPRRALRGRNPLERRRPTPSKLKAAI